LLLLFVILLSHVFFSVVSLLLSQWWTPPLMLQVSDCRTFLLMFDVPSTVAFIEDQLNVVLVLFHDFLNLCLQFPWPHWLLVWQSISCSTFAESLYLDFYILIYFVLSFCITFLSDGIAT
jgi:hypothetical protein